MRVPANMFLLRVLVVIIMPLLVENLVLNNKFNYWSVISVCKFLAGMVVTFNAYHMNCECTFFFKYIVITLLCMLFL
jgi:hypothetical protein